MSYHNNGGQHGGQHSGYQNDEYASSAQSFNSIPQAYGSNRQPNTGYPSQPYGSNQAPSTPVYPIGFTQTGPPQGFNQPGYPSQGYNQPRYPSQGYNQPGYPSQPSANPGYPPQSSANPGYLPQGFNQQPTYSPQPSVGYGSAFNQPSYPPPPIGNQLNYPQASYTNQPAAQQTNRPDQYQKTSIMNYSNPSVRMSANFNANTDAEALRKAMKGFGCNNTKVIEVLCARTNYQRQEIARAFKGMYGKDLISDLKSELHGDFEDLIIALMTPPAVFDAEQIKRAVRGFGTREHVLIECMVTRTRAQIAELKMVYKNLYKTELERDLIGDTSSWFQRILVALCAGNRDESGFTDPLKANQDARNLYKAGEKRLGTDESEFLKVFCSQSLPQLLLVLQEYKKVAGHGVDKAIASEFSGDIRDTLMAIVKVVENKALYFAELLENSMKGMGTRDTDLIRLVVTRSEIDLADIRQEFEKRYGRSLEKTIAGDCSGAYKEGLIKLVKGN
uniref:Annexin n=1 Tax=Rhabditophanes sp. KR3021 TaxID=114890 RepID=A0AC35TTD8_9BILA